MTIVIQVICRLLDIYYFVLIARILLSYVARPPELLLPVIRAVGAVTDPLLMPLRRVLPPVRVGPAALDMSPIVLFVVILLVRGLLPCR